MRSEQLSNLKRGDSQTLFELVNTYKNDVLTLSTMLNVNKDNVDKLDAKDFEGLCSDSFINVLKELKNAPSGPAFRKWLLKTVYNKTISNAMKLEPKKDTKTWKKFSVVNCEIDSDKLFSKLAVLPIKQRLAIWASCYQNMNIAEAANFFDIDADDYASLLSQALQGIRNRFPSDSSKMPETIKVDNMVDIVYRYFSPSEKVDFEKELQTKKLRKKYYDLLVNERKLIGSSFKPAISEKEILAGIRSKLHLVRKRLNPIFFVSLNLFILIIIGFIVIYFNSIVKPSEILVNVDHGIALLKSDAIKSDKIPAKTTILTRQYNSDYNVKKTMLIAGDSIKTINYSSITCIINDINSLQMGSNSEIEVFEQTKLAPVRMKIISGYVLFNITNSKISTKIITLFGEFITFGGQFLIELLDNKCNLLVFEGAVELYTNSSKILVFNCKKGNAISINYSGYKSIDKFKDYTAINKMKDNQYYFSIDEAKKYYLDRNGKLKIVFHWLDSLRYPFILDKVPGNIYEIIKTFSYDYNKQNRILEKLKDINKNYKIKLDKIYKKSKQLDKLLNYRKIDAKNVLINQKELQNVYIYLGHTNNTISYLNSKGFKNVQFTDFDYYLKKYYSQENRFWLSNIKELQDYKVELTTLKAIKKGINDLLNILNRTKKEFEEEIHLLSNQVSSIDEKLGYIESIKTKSIKADEVIVKLNIQLTNNKKNIIGLADDISIIEKSKAKNDIIISSINELLKNQKETIDKRDNKQNNLIKISEAIESNENTLTVLKKTLLNIESSAKSLIEDKNKYETEISNINNVIEIITSKLNNSINDRAKTSLKLSEIGKTIKTMNSNIAKHDEDITNLDNKINKQHILLENQEKAILNLTQQYNNISTKIQKNEIEKKEFLETIMTNANLINENDSKIQTLKSDIVDYETKNEILKEQFKKNYQQLENLISQIVLEKNSVIARKDYIEELNKEQDDNIIKIEIVENNIELLTKEKNNYKIIIIDNNKKLEDEKQECVQFEK
ncbi:MAG: hypothetical protein K8S18_12735, partial [Desulfobacula sp.]|nr:hypothetical protein [Desulfobacula sp.]